MSSSSGVEGTLASPPTEQQANAPVAKTMDAKLMLATGNGDDVQQLKDMVNKQDSQMMVVVMAKQPAVSAPKPHPLQGNMHLNLLALASSGSSEELQTLLSGEGGQASSHGGGTNRGGLTSRRGSSFGDDTEANESILEGVTAEGDTALHVVVASGQGEKHGDSQNDKWWRWCLIRTEGHASSTTYGYGDGDNFLKSARIIYGKAKHLLFVQNNKGDTPLHCAARAGKSKMVACLIDLAVAEGDDGRVMKELLRKENKNKETALHEAVRFGNKDLVDLLMGKDSELASFPQDGGASPLYLAIVLERDEIVKTLYDLRCDGKLSFSGPNGQNALHAAVLRYRDHTVTELLEWNKTHLCLQNKDLTTQRDENGSTPLHFAAAIKKPSSICRQVLEANPDALYQPDHAGLFPIHFAASVGASSNIAMFVKKCPGSAGLRDAKGRTFLHVAVENWEVKVIRSTCRNLSPTWILNMVDNDGNTALHLAVKTGSLRLFCPLLGNPQVNMNLPNNKGETPLDVAGYNLPEHGLYYTQNSEVHIPRALIMSDAVSGVSCQDDLLEDNRTSIVKHNERKLEMEGRLKDSTGTLGIGSVLIATVTFGATFAVPGGYIADDHLSNAGSPVLARRYAFDAFIVSNTLAFVLSAMATTALMQSGSPLYNPRSRIMQLGTALYLVSISTTCLVAAFALGAYVVLAPVAHKTAVATCVLSSLAMLYKSVDFYWRHLLLLPPFRRRNGLICTLAYSAYVFICNMLYEYWPLIFIFGWAAHANLDPTLQAPAPLASGST